MNKRFLSLFLFSFLGLYLLGQKPSLVLEKPSVQKIISHHPSGLLYLVSNSNEIYSYDGQVLTQLPSEYDLLEIIDSTFYLSANQSLYICTDLNKESYKTLGIPFDKEINGIFKEKGSLLISSDEHLRITDLESNSHKLKFASNIDRERKILVTEEHCFYATGSLLMDPVITIKY